ncbi:Large ribosomal subunit protein uL23m [Cladobotryum mycophilum]|uniref:Large ribosomal subunit protein uL23m n=1 Tax=Cladobotryum mycophilum TaxID=491253 RepID=A0ABR0S6Z4_9HYPO
MAEVVKAAARQLPGFRLGQKQVYLPNHIITFLRKEHLPPNEACFQVPLRFTKFDLRDYLWNLYNVEVRKVRSYVKEQPLTQRSDHSRSWYRPLPLKIMTVELDKPFQWPDAPEDLTPWNKELWDMREEDREEQSDLQHIHQQGKVPLLSADAWNKERTQLSALAKKMLSGEVKWENNVALDPKWDKILDKKVAKTAAKTAEKPPTA